MIRFKEMSLLLHFILIYTESEIRWKRCYHGLNNFSKCALKLENGRKGGVGLTIDQETIFTEFSHVKL